jgi:hypothetical protein
MPNKSAEFIRSFRFDRIRDARPGRRALRRIERNLARSDPDLDRLFLSFTSRAGRRWTPPAARIAPWPLRVLARLRHGAHKPTPDSSSHHL